MESFWATLKTELVNYEYFEVSAQARVNHLREAADEQLSDVTKAAVKQCNKRVKGTGQFRHNHGVESILAMRTQWINQDQRGAFYWVNGPSYVNSTPA